jgi:hypothetical protein
MQKRFFPRPLTPFSMTVTTAAQTTRCDTKNKRADSEAEGTLEYDNGMRLYDMSGIPCERDDDDDFRQTKRRKKAKTRFCSRRCLL